MQGAVLVPARSFLDGIITPPGAALLEPARDGDAITQKAVRARPEREGVTIELTVVQELRSVEPLETSHVEQALQRLGLQPPGIPEQHRCRLEEEAVPYQTQPAHQLLRFPTAGSFSRPIRTASPTLLWISTVEEGDRRLRTRT